MNAFELIKLGMENSVPNKRKPFNLGVDDIQFILSHASDEVEEAKNYKDIDNLREEICDAISVLYHAAIVANINLDTINRTIKQKLIYRFDYSKVYEKYSNYYYLDQVRIVDLKQQKEGKWNVLEET